jgi:type IV pilus assembly protein PilF
VSRRALAVLGTALWLAAVAVAQAEEKIDLKQAAEVNAQLAITYLKQNNLIAARDKIERALDQNPRSSEVQMAAGFVYDRLGDDRKAESAFEQAVKIGGKDNPLVLNNAGAFLCRKGDKKLGEQYFLQAAASALYPTPEFAFLNAGQCARADGRPKDAERNFRQALAIKPNLGDALYQLGDLLHAAGNDLQARAFVQRYHEVAPPSASSLWLGYRVERALGDDAAAGEYARRLRAGFATSPEAGQLFDMERAGK